MGVKVDTSTVVLGDFECQGEPYTFTFPRNEVPEGFFVRGSFSQCVTFESNEGVAAVPKQSTFEIVAKTDP